MRIWPTPAGTGGGKIASSAEVGLLAGQLVLLAKKPVPALRVQVVDAARAGEARSVRTAATAQVRASEECEGIGPPGLGFPTSGRWLVTEARVDLFPSGRQERETALLWACHGKSRGVAGAERKV